MEPFDLMIELEKLNMVWNGDAYLSLGDIDENKDNASSKPHLIGWYQKECAGEIFDIHYEYCYNNKTGDGFWRKIK